MAAVEMGAEVRPFNLDQWIISISSQDHSHTPTWRIEKIPAQLRRDKHNKQEYEPKVVSLGPYHHKKPELQLAEKFKEVSLQIYCFANEKTIPDLFNKVKMEIAWFRRCYVEGSTDEYSDDEFTKMMVLDGCFILNVVDSIVSETTTRNYSYKQKQKQEQHAKNQKQFQQNQKQLQLMVSEAEVEAESVHSEEDTQVFDPRSTLSDGPKKTPVADGYREEDTQVSGPKYNISDGPKRTPVAVSYQERLGGLGWANIFRDMYLLENQIPYGVLEKLGAEAETINSFVNLTIHRQDRECASSHSNGSPSHLLEIYRNCFLSKSVDDRFQSYDYQTHKITRYTHSFRSVTELKQKGIRFRPSSSTSLTGIKFTSSGFYGQLELPCRLITSSTKAIFLNLIAYEMCPYTPNDYSVTSYVGFMKSLINDSNDVKELRSKHILLNKLESDVELAKMFEDISIPTVNNGFYEGVKEKIQEHYTNKAKTWMAELISRYFNSPWSTTALLAAFLLLVLTFLQTFFTIFPKYSKK